MDPKDERARVAYDAGREREHLLDVLLGENGDAGRDPTDEGERDGVRGGVLRHVCETCLGIRVAVDNLNGAGLLGVTMDVASLFEGLEMHMNGGGRGQAYRGADLAHRRGVAMLLGV